MPDNIEIPSQIGPSEGVDIQNNYSGDYTIKSKPAYVQEGLLISRNANASTDSFGLVAIDTGDQSAVDALNAAYPEAWSFFTKDESVYSYSEANADILVKAVNLWLYINGDETTNSFYDEVNGVLSYDADEVHINSSVVNPSTEVTGTGFLYADPETGLEIPNEFRIPFSNGNINYADLQFNEDGEPIDANGAVIPYLYIPYQLGSNRTLEFRYKNTYAHALLSSEYLALEESQITYRRPLTEYEWGGSYATAARVGFDYSDE